jgi:hypothetical protein
MESHPGKIAAESIPPIEVMRVKLKIRAIELAVGDPFDVHLRRDENQDPENKRNEQSKKSFS